MRVVGMMASCSSRGGRGIPPMARCGSLALTHQALQLGREATHQAVQPLFVALERGPLRRDGCRGCRIRGIMISAA